jgi:hypothetical protein
MVILLHNAHMREKKKTTIKKRSLTKATRKTRNYTKKKSYGEAHVGQE